MINIVWLRETVNKINVLLDIQVNNDSPVTVAGSDEPGIKTNSIVTKLLVSDGDIVVIGGIKKNVISNSKNQTPGLGNMPVIGNLFKGKANSDNLDETKKNTISFICYTDTTKKLKIYAEKS